MLYSLQNLRQHDFCVWITVMQNLLRQQYHLQCIKGFEVQQGVTNFAASINMLNFTMWNLSERTQTKYKIKHIRSQHNNDCILTEV
jgi:hypothetical protein